MSAKKNSTLIVWNVLDVSTERIKAKTFLALKLKGNGKQTVERHGFDYNGANTTTIYIDVEDLPYIMREQKKVVGKHIENELHKLRSINNAVGAEVL